MPLDPISLAIEAVPLLREAVERYVNKNEARQFFYQLRDKVEGDNTIAPEVRQDLAERLFYLLAEPDLVRPLDAYLERGDEDSESAISEFVRRAVEGVVPPDTQAQVLDSAMHDVRVAATRAKQSDRDAMVLQTERLRTDIQQLGQGVAPVAFLDLEWAPDWPQRALRMLADESPPELVGLRERVGAGRDLGVIERLIKEPDDWTANASGHVWVALARFAEHHGEWMLAREAWHRALDDPPRGDPVPILLHAAMNASIAGEEAEYEADLAAARSIDDRHPRLKFEEISQSSKPPEQQLEELAELSFQESHLRGLLEARRALQHLLLGDIEAARRDVEAAKSADPDLIQAQLVEVNLVIHENRLATARGTPIDAGATNRAAEQSLELREKLLSQKRPEEAARLLMLAADAATIVGDRERAYALLEGATDEELSFGEGDEALADAALRARNPQLATTLLQPGKPDSDSRRRIRAHASIVGNEADFDEAVDELDELIAGGSPERSMAAGPRILAALRGAPWSDEAEQALRDENRPHAVITRALWLTRQGCFREAKALLEPERTAWAREALFRAAVVAGQPEAAAEVAYEYLQLHVPPSDLRLEFADVFLNQGDTERARAELRQIAGDNRAPASDRQLAFLGTVRLGPSIVEKHDALTEWRTAFPDDAMVDREYARLDAELRAGL